MKFISKAIIGYIFILSLILIYISFALNSKENILLKPLNNIKVNTVEDAPSHPLNFSPFYTSLNRISEKRYNELNDLISGQDISSLNNSLRKGYLSVTELTLFYVHNIYKDENKHNAIISLNPNILKEAKALDKKKDFDSSPFYGIPILVSDEIVTNDAMFTTIGSKILEDTALSRENNMITLLKDKGALVLGKTNVTELNGLLSDQLPAGFSAIGGQTKNPFLPFKVGVANSGASVAIRLGYAPLAIGTETLDSSFESVSLTGTYAFRPTLDPLFTNNILTAIPDVTSMIPITNNLKDLTSYFNTVNANGTPFATTKPKTNLLAGTRIGYIEKESSNLSDVISKFKDIGADLIPINLDKDYTTDYQTLLTVQCFNFKTSINNLHLGFPKDIAEWLEFNETNPKMYIPYGQNILKFVNIIDMPDDKSSQKVNKILLENTQYLDNLFHKNQLDFILSTNSTGCELYQFSGAPALTIPMEYHNLKPLNLTIIAPKDKDNELLELAVTYKNQS